MIKDIQLRRLKDVQVKGNFTIKCFHWKTLDNIHNFLQYDEPIPHYMYVAKLKFKDLQKLNPRPSATVSNVEPQIAKDHRCIIMYESMHELLKLREIFQIRANKFDCYLIDKRKYNPFNADFFDKLRDPVIHKVRK